MKIIKKRFAKVASIFLLALMISAVFFAISNNASTVQASTTSIPSSMLQYEWTRPSADDANTYAVQGPAPSTPNIQ